MNQTEALKELSRLCLGVAEGKQLQAKLHSGGWQDIPAPRLWLCMDDVENGRIRLKPEPRKVWIGVFQRTDGSMGSDIFESRNRFDRFIEAGKPYKPLSFFEHIIEEKP